MYGKFGIDDNVIAFASEVEKGLGERFAEIDKNAEYNALKVIKAMQDSCVSEACLHGTTGYGYNDIGREKLEEVYSRVFHTEAALVRPLISCGTHALSTALFAVLRPGDEMISITGKPYDTLEEVIGIRPSKGSLAEFGVTYKQVELTPEGTFDHEAIRNAISEKTKLVEIQRSKGYLNRPSLSVKEIGEAIKTVKSVRSDIICMVDNCYGEFVDTIEPSDVGADMCVGSLIKNPGGGLAPIGGYIAGTEEIVDLCGIRLTSPGLGREVGASLEVNSRLFQGLFMAPTVTASALKGAIFAANCYERLGYEVIPDGTEKRNDIIQAVTMKTPEALVAFCKGIQKAAPVDSYVDPEPDEMPGYDSKVIMAAGAFVQGSSIELSADGPLREPYSVYFQGGLTWPSAKLGIIMTIQQLKNEGIITV
ncbi:MAG: aminotransferase class I/II-fold pyridoxal phosphate-dependent enzyme [Lachnospiraceae bacterium]